LAPSGIKAAPGGSYYAKSTKNRIFVQYSHRLAELPLPPGGSSQKTQNWVKIHASPGGILKAARRFLGIFQKRVDKEIFLSYKGITFI